jgi:hypothetical protein
MKNLNTIYLLLPVFLILIFQACSGTQTERRYDNKYIKDIPLNSGKISNLLIDNEPTFEIFFKLKEATDCMRITVLSSYYTDTIPKTRIAAKSFFILEKLVDISQFKKSEKKALYTEIGKNFDTQWTQNPVLNICTQPEEPLGKLDAATFYRLRFSSLSKELFSYKITIESDSEIQFIGE